MMRLFTYMPIAIVLVASFACTPTVKVEAPDKPIVIDLNVKIEHRVKVEIDRDLDKVMKDDSLF